MPIQEIIHRIFLVLLTQMGVVVFVCLWVVIDISVQMLRDERRMRLRHKRGPDRQSGQRQASQADSNVENTQRGPEKEGETTMSIDEARPERIETYRDVIVDAIHYASLRCLERYGQDDPQTKGEWTAYRDMGNLLEMGFPTAEETAAFERDCEIEQNRRGNE